MPIVVLFEMTDAHFATEMRWNYQYAIDNDATLFFSKLAPANPPLKALMSKWKSTTGITCGQSAALLLGASEQHAKSRSSHRKCTQTVEFRSVCQPWELATTGGFRSLYWFCIWRGTQCCAALIISRICRRCIHCITAC